MIFFLFIMETFSLEARNIWIVREIFEVPGVYANPRRQTLTLASTVYVKYLKYMKLVEFDNRSYKKCRQLSCRHLICKLANIMSFLDMHENWWLRFGLWCLTTLLNCLHFLYDLYRR
jgi:hypothetical protein